MGKIERMKAYHNSWSTDDIAKARGHGIVIDDGEAWRYQYTHTDEIGIYDLWYRDTDPITDPADSSAPAFAHGDPEHGGDPGMTLRQWYAGKALQGYLSSCNPGLPSDHAAAVIAEQAFKLADAMLAEDQKERN